MLAKTFAKVGGYRQGAVNKEYFVMGYWDDDPIIELEGKNLAAVVAEIQVAGFTGKGSSNKLTYKGYNYATVKRLVELKAAPKSPKWLNTMTKTISKQANFQSRLNFMIHTKRIAISVKMGKSDTSKIWFTKYGKKTKI